MHPQVVPAEAAQHFGAEPQGLAQARPADDGIRFDDDGTARVRAGEGQLAAVAERHGEAKAFQAAGQVDQHRLARVGNLGLVAARLGLAEHLGEREDAVALAILVDVGGAEAGNDVHGPAGPGHADGQQPLAARFTERTEVRQETAVRGAAVADGEDHPVAALRHGLLEGEHSEWLGPVFQDEVGEVGTLGEGGQHGLVHTHGVPRAGRDDHE